MIAEKDFAGCQTRGVRELQEDAYGFTEITGSSGSKDGILVVVADGMGGHNAGERASALALKTFLAEFQERAGPLTKRMHAALHAANYAIADQLQREPECEGMGTTFLAACITRPGIEWVSVGDSPLYLCRKGSVSRLNEDHSLRPILDELAQRGESPRWDTKERGSRSILRAALLGEEIAMIDQSRKPLPLQGGDVIIAASDGIHTLIDREIGEACADSDLRSAQELAANILRAINRMQNPKQDNATIIVVKPKADDEGLVLPL